MRTLITIATILVPAAASAGGYLIPSTSPRDLGLSQTAVADEEGAEAVSLNVAALAGQDGLDVGLALGMLSNRTDWSDPTLGSASMAQVNTPPGIAISYGRKLDNGQAWGIGAGFGTPAGGSIAWPNGWAGQQYIQSVKQQVFAVLGGAAYQIAPSVKLGASFVRFQANEEIHQSINFLDHVADAGLGLAGGASTFTLAAQLNVPSVPLSFGLTYAHAANIDLTGHAHFTGVPAQYQDMIHDQPISETLLIPDVVTVGAAYEAMPNLKVMAGYEFEHWSGYKSDTFVGADVITGSDGMPTHFTSVVPRNYNDAHVLRLAGEWKKLPFLPQLTGRLGVQRSISDQPTDTLSPSLTDASSWGVAVGAGLALSSGLRIDFGYQHVFFDSVTATGAEALPGTYKTAVDLLSLGVNWRTDLGMGAK